MYHCLDNRRDQHATKPGEAAAEGAGGLLEFPIECAEILDILMVSSAGSGGDGDADDADWVAVGDLPPPEDDEEGEDAAPGVTPDEVVQSLLQAGVLVVKADD